VRVALAFMVACRLLEANVVVGSVVDAYDRMSGRGWQSEDWRSGGWELRR